MPSRRQAASSATQSWDDALSAASLAQTFAVVAADAPPAERASRT
jgi:hypothetical protein